MYLQNFCFLGKCTLTLVTLELLSTFPFLLPMFDVIFRILCKPFTLKCAVQIWLMLPYSCSNCLQDLILSSAACPVSQNFTTCCLMLQIGELFCRGSNGWVLHRRGSRAIILVLVLCENDNRTCLNIADQCIQWWSFMLSHLLTPHFSPSSHCQTAGSAVLHLWIHCFLSTSSISDLNSSSLLYFGTPHWHNHFFNVWFADCHGDSTL